MEPTGRLGCEEMGGFGPLKAHEFFKGIDWDNLHKMDPPDLLPYLPASKKDEENLWSEKQVNIDIFHCVKFGKQINCMFLRHSPHHVQPPA